MYCFRVIYKTTVLPVVLYGSQTWSLTLREEYGLRGSGNGVLRIIFVPSKRDEVRKVFIVEHHVS